MPVRSSFIIELIYDTNCRNSNSEEAESTGDKTLVTAGSTQLRRGELKTYKMAVIVTSVIRFVYAIPMAHNPLHYAIFLKYVLVIKRYSIRLAHLYISLFVELLFLGRQFTIHSLFTFCFQLEHSTSKRKTYIYIYAY